MTSLIVSLHDVAPASAEMSRRWLDQLDELGVKASLLVIPGYWKSQDFKSNKNFIQWLHTAEENGHEIVQHGLHHEKIEQRKNSPSSLRKQARQVAGKLMARGCEEFWDIDYAVAHSRLLQGRQNLESAGFQVHGFIAPGWLMSHAAIRAVKELGYKYTTSHTKVSDFSAHTEHRSFAFSFRATNSSARLSAETMKLAGNALVKMHRNLRIALHPDDLSYEILRRTALNLITHATGSGFTACTYFNFLSSQMQDQILKKVD
jgi:predicted deacetylase